MGRIGHARCGRSPPVRSRALASTLPMKGRESRVRTHKLNKKSDDDFEPRTDLNQPVGGWPVLTAN